MRISAQWLNIFQFNFKKGWNNPLQTAHILQKICSLHLLLLTNPLHLVGTIRSPQKYPQVFVILSSHLGRQVDLQHNTTAKFPMQKKKKKKKICNLWQSSWTWQFHTFPLSSFTFISGFVTLFKPVPWFWSQDLLLCMNKRVKKDSWICAPFVTENLYRTHLLGKSSQISNWGKTLETAKSRHRYSGVNCDLVR